MGGDGTNCKNEIFKNRYYNNAKGWAFRIKYN